MPSTAILLFSHSPANEARRKVLTGKPNRDRAVYRLLNERVAEAGRLAKLPLFTAERQSGRGFGERLRRALLPLLEAGHDRVIVLGNDCPSLRTADLREADRCLQRGEAVLGPSPDGGAWMIGLHAGDIRRLDWNALPWCTERLFRELEAALRGLGGTVRRLAERSDLDRLGDLLPALRGAMPVLKRALLRLLVRDSFPSPTLSLFPDAEAIGLSRLLRAPPVGC